MTPTAQDQLSAYLDGELSDEEVRVLEQALEGDAELRHQLARLERVQNLLRTHGPVLAPEGFTERVQAAVADEPRVAVPWWKGRSLEGAALLLAAAAALLIALPSQTSLTDALSPASRNETVDKRDRYEDAVAAAPEERMAEDPLDPPPSLEQADLRGRADEGMSAAAAEGQAAPAPAETNKPASKKSPKDNSSMPSLMKGLEAKGTAEATGEGLETNTGALAGETANTGYLDDDTLVSAGLQYRIYVDSVDALAALQRLAGKHGTTLQTESGEAIQTGALSTSETSVYVTVSADNASAFANALSSVGKVQYESSTDMIRGPNPRIRIDLVLIGGGVGTDGEDAPNASRKAKESLEAEAP